MKRPVKIGLIIAGILAALIITAMIVVPIVVDPNTYKPQIVKAVEDATGRSFSIGGDISVSVFPWIGARIEGPVILGNAEGFGDDPMLTLDEAQVKIKLLPLLFKRIEVGTVVLRTPIVNLGVLPDGTTNWDDLVAKQEAAPGQESAPAPANAPSGAGPGMDIVIAGVVISDGVITWDDQQNKQWARISELDLDVEGIEPGKPSDIDVACAIESRNPDAKGAVKLKTRATVKLEEKQATADGLSLRVNIDQFAHEDGMVKGTLDMDASIFADWGIGDARLRNLKLKLDGESTSVPGGTVNLSLDTTATANWLRKSFAADAIDLDAKASNLRLKDAAEQPMKGSLSLKGKALSGDYEALQFAADSLNLKAEAENVRLGEADADPLSGKANATSGRLNIDAKQGDVEARELKIAAEAQGAAVPGGKADVTMTGDLALNWLKETFLLQGFKLSGLGLDVTSPSLEATGFLSKPMAKGSIKVAEFSPRRLMTTLGMEPIATTDPKALEKFALDARFDTTQQATRVESLTVILDETTLSGTASVSDMTKPVMTFDLKADAINVDRYMPPKTDKKPEPAPTPRPGEPGAPQQGELPVEQLKQMDIDGKVAIDRITLYKIPARNVTMQLLAKNGVVKVDPIGLEVFGGKLTLNAMTDVSRPTPLSNLGLKVVALDLDQALMALTGKSTAGAKLGLDVNLTGNGAQYRRIMETLNGKLSLLVQDGVYRGVVLEPDRFDIEKGYVPKPGDESRNTELRDFSLNFDVANGMARLPKTDVKTSGPADIAIRGQSYIPDQALDFLLDANVGPVSVPVALKGTYDNVQAGVDTAELARRVLRAPLSAVEGVIGGVEGAVGGVGGVVGGAIDAITGGNRTTEDQQDEPKKSEDPVRGFFRGLGLEPKPSN